MLFKTEFHDALRSGRIRRTYRRWTSAKVKVGGRYRFAVGHALEVERLTRTSWAEISDADARSAGFEGRAALGAELERSGRRPLEDDESLYRVDFRYVADAPQQPPVKSSPAEVVAELDAIERRSRSGPWAWRALAWIAANPRRRAADLAADIQTEVRPLKGRIRRLKALGLTRSHEVGYEATSLGLEVLELRRARE